VLSRLVVIPLGFSRRIEKRLVEDVACRVIAAYKQPDHATIARFRATAHAEFREHDPGSAVAARLPVEDQAKRHALTDPDPIGRVRALDSNCYLLHATLELGEPDRLRNEEEPRQQGDQRRRADNDEDVDVTHRAPARVLSGRFEPSTAA